MKRVAFVVLASVFAATATYAQQSGEPSLKQLELDGSRGYAVVLDGEGNEHYCEAKVGRDAVDLGPCKPLRLLAPLNSETRDVQLPSTPSVSPAKRSVIALFERNRCTLAYADLKAALESLGARQRQIIGETISEMTDRGEIADDAVRERAVLKIGDRCS